MRYRKVEMSYRFYKRCLRGRNVDYWAADAMAKYMSKDTWNNKVAKRRSKELKMRLSDYVIMMCTKKIRNTKLARMLNTNNMIRPYSEKEEWIRILLPNLR